MHNKWLVILLGVFLTGLHASVTVFFSDKPRLATRQAPDKFTKFATTRRKSPRTLLLEGVYIRFCGNGHLGFRPDGGSLSKSAKVTKALLPHHLVPRLGSACPHSGIAPWAAAKGHPWPSAANPASMPGCPLRNACVRPSWLMGRPRSTSTTRRPGSRPGS
jgi:hypothetical protein